MAVPIVAAALLGGCGGGMGQSHMAGGGATDKGSLASTLDAPLAVGGEVRPAVRLQIKGSTAPPTHLVAPVPGILDVHDGLIVGKRPGVAPVFVALDENNTVVDFYHVWVRAADRLEVHGIDGGGNDVGPMSEAVELLVGHDARFVPHPYAGSEPLVGVARSSWVVDPPIAIVLREGLPNRVHLVAQKPGTATVTVSMLGATSTMNLKVLP